MDAVVAPKPARKVAARKSPVAAAVVVTAPSVSAAAVVPVVADVPPVASAAPKPSGKRAGAKAAAASTAAPVVAAAAEAAATPAAKVSKAPSVRKSAAAAAKSSVAAASSVVSTSDPQAVPPPVVKSKSASTGGKKRSVSAGSSAEDGASPSRPPFSPRFVANSFIAEAANAEATLPFSEVRKRAEVLARAVSRFAAISSSVGKSKSGTYSIHGKVYDAESLKDMKKSLTAAITALPCVSRSSCKKTMGALSAEERSRRITVHLARAREAADAVAAYIKHPEIANALYAKAATRVEAVRKPSRVDIATPRSGCFYVSSQFVEFVRGGNFGNGIALFFSGLSEKTHALQGTTPAGAEACIAAVANELKIDPVAALGVSREVALQLADPRRMLTPLIVSQFATSPLLMTIVARYARVNDLRDENGRIRIDKNMRRRFGPGTNTRWIVKGADGKEVDLTPPEELANPNSRFHKSALELLAARETKTGGEAPCDENTFMRTMSIALASNFIIPNAPESVVPNVKNQEFSKLAAGVNLYI